MHVDILITCLLCGILSSAESTVPLGHPDFLPTPDHPIGWRGDRTGNFPGATPVDNWSDGTIDREKFSYHEHGQEKEAWGWVRSDGRQRNILWKTRMPGYTNSQPLVVGKKVFTLAEPDSLVCVDLDTGGILWRRRTDVTTLIGLDEAEQQALREYIDVCHTIYALIKNQVDNYTRLPDLADEADRASWKRRYGKVRDLYQHLVTGNRFGEHAKPFLERTEQWLAQIDTFTPPMKAGDFKQINEKVVGPLINATGWIPATHRFMPLAHWTGFCGWTYPTPISDGEHIFITFGQGQTVAYDLDGNRAWVTFVPLEKEGNRIPSGSNGIQTLVSPMLVGDVLIGQHRQKLIGYDKRTGGILWEQAEIKSGGYTIGSHIPVTMADGRTVIVTIGGKVLDPGTGAIIGSTGVAANGGERSGNSLVADGDVVFFSTGGNSGGLQKAVRVVPDGDAVKGQVLWETHGDNEGITGAVANGWYYRLAGRGGDAFHIATGEKISTGVSPSWASPIIAGNRICFYQHISRQAARASDDFIVEAYTFRIDPETRRTSDLGLNYLLDDAVPPLEACETWAPELTAGGWTVTSCGGIPGQYGYAPMFAHGDKLIIRSCTGLVCVGPRLKGAPGDDLTLGERLAASTDLALLEQHIADDNPYYRNATVAAAAADATVAKGLHARLLRRIAEDNYPEIRGLALDAIMTADPAAPILKILITDLETRKLAWEPITKRHTIDTLLHASDRTKALIIPMIRPENVQRGALYALNPVMWQAARAHPKLFAETIAPVFEKLDDQARRGYVRMFAVAGAEGIAALPVLRRFAEGGNMDALVAIRDIDPATFEELAPMIAKQIGESFATWATNEKEAHRLLHFLSGDIARLKLLGKHQQGAVAGMQRFVDATIPKEEDRTQVAAMIELARTGSLR